MKGKVALEHNGSYLLDESIGKTACIKRQILALNMFKKTYSTFQPLNKDRIIINEGIEYRTACTSAFNDYIYDGDSFTGALNSKNHHPVSGPFSIGELKEDEDICIEIKRIQPFNDIVWCLTRSAGALKDNYNDITNSEYSRKMRIIESNDHIKTQQCSIGFVGTISKEKMSTGRGCSHGGNLDFPCVKAGSIVILPSLHKSSDVWFGDIHYKQGWGELSGVALECSGLISFIQKRILLIHKTNEPIIIEPFEKDIFLYFVGIRETFEQALQAAIINILQYKRVFDCFDDNEMYYKIGTDANLMIGQSIGKTISLAIKLKIDKIENLFRERVSNG